MGECVRVCMRVQVHVHGDVRVCTCGCLGNPKHVVKTCRQERTHCHPKMFHTPGCKWKSIFCPSHSANSDSLSCNIACFASRCTDSSRLLAFQRVRLCFRVPHGGGLIENMLEFSVPLLPFQPHKAATLQARMSESGLHCLALR